MNLERDDESKISHHALDIRRHFCLNSFAGWANTMSLVLRRIKDEIPGSSPGEDYAVFSGSLRLGRIHKIALTSGRARWHWNLYALHGPPDKIVHDGYTDSLKQAKAEFAASVRAFLALARWREVDPPRA